MRINHDKKREDGPSSYLVDAASWHHVSTPVIPFPDLLIVFYPTERLIRACFENKRAVCESVCGPFAEGVMGSHRESDGSVNENRGLSRSLVGKGLAAKRERNSLPSVIRFD